MLWLNILLHLLACWAIFTVGHFCGYTKAASEPERHWDDITKGDLS